MSLESDIRDALLNMGTVTALVGTGNAARIRPYKLALKDDREEEHIIVDVDVKDRENDLTGRAGLVTAKVTLSCRAMTRTEANALAEAVRRNGTTPSTGMSNHGGSGTAFESWLDDENPDIIRFDDKSDRVWHAVDQDYIVQYTEAV